MKEAIEKLLEYIHQHSEGSCLLCCAEDYPVLGDKKGYENVKPQDAEEWQLEHYDDCPVIYLEALLRSQLKDDVFEIRIPNLRQEEIPVVRKEIRKFTKQLLNTLTLSRRIKKERLKNE